MSLRIVTYNIRGALGMDDVRSLPRIADVLHTLDADIVCLQEVHQNLPWSGFVNQPRRLRRLLGAEVIFQRNLSLLLGGFGNAIVTKAPILQIKRHALPGGREPRGCLEVTLQTALGELKVLCTHLGLSDGERRRQVMRLSEIVRAAQSPVILCGDFNERPEAGNLRLLLEQTHLYDAGLGGDFTYSSDAPRARIDFVLLSETLRVEDTIVSPSLASDHYPVISKIKLNS